MFESEFGGVQLASDAELGELPIARGKQAQHLRLISGTTEPRTPLGTWIHHWKSGDEVVISLGKVEERYVLRFDDGSCFEFDREARTVAHPSPLDASSRHQLLDQVLPRVLDDLGYLMIHGSAVGTSGSAVVFIGETGHGKSTLAASFLRAGIDLLCDDCMRLTTGADGGVTCVPTYRTLRLWPDSAEAVMPTAPFAPMSERSDKRRLGLPAATTEDPTTVSVICVLGAPDQHADSVTFATLAPARAVALLLAQCFRLDPTDAQSTRRTFERCADVVERVPVVELNYPRDYDRLPDVRKAVLEKAKSGDWTAITAT